MEVGHQNQQRILSNNTSSVSVVHQFNRFCGAKARPSKEAETHSIAKLMGSSKIVDKIGHPTTIKSTWPWLKSVIIVFSSMPSLRYDGKKKTQTITLQGNRVNSLENHEDTDNGEDKNLIFNNYNE